MSKKKPMKHIVLTSHPGSPGKQPIEIKWGAANPQERGPLVAAEDHRNVIGTHSGSYMIYRALAVAAGQLNPEHRPDLKDTNPVAQIGPFPSWHDKERIVSLDPYGATIATHFKDKLEQGWDIRPTIAITQAHIDIPELKESIHKGIIKPDGKVLMDNGSCFVTKAAIEPVWYLPGIAKRFNIEEHILRRTLFENTGGMYPELVTRPDLKAFLPPIGGISVYIFGDANRLTESPPIACRVHDECNGSDVFGSDICTCRPYLIHGIEVCIEQAQKEGVGLIIYNRKEGRALGEVTKFLVYNARKRQTGGDTASKYFERTECIAGVQDMRFQELMPDTLHWLGIKKLDQFVSMSDMKYNAIVSSGISITNRIGIPEDRIPEDAKVEIDAKKAAGYFSNQGLPSAEELQRAKGRSLDE